VQQDPSAERLAGVLRDRTASSHGWLCRWRGAPEDVRVAARNLRELSCLIPGFLPWRLRAPLRAAAALGDYSVASRSRDAIRATPDGASPNS